MENEVNKRDNKTIVFIDRKKNSYLKDKLNSFIENFYIKNIERQYFDENYIFKVLYDKIYRPDIFRFLMNSDSKQVNINVTKNILKMNESKLEFKFKRIKSFDNDLSLLNTENFADDEIFTENNYLNYMHKMYIKERFARYSSFLLCVSSAFLKFGLKKNNIANITLVMIAINIGYIFYLNQNKNKVFNDEFDKLIVQKNQHEIRVYKKYY